MTQSLISACVGVVIIFILSYAYIELSNRIKNSKITTRISSVCLLALMSFTVGDFALDKIIPLIESGIQNLIK